MLSAIGLLVTLFLALIGWRIQLIGKRRTELAEEALLAFAHAIDAIKAIRSPLGWSNESDALRKELGKDPNDKIRGERFHITLWRMRQHQSKFEILRGMQLLCEFHFGEKASSAFNDIRESFNDCAKCTYRNSHGRGGWRAQQRPRSATSTRGYNIRGPIGPRPHQCAE